MASTNAIAIRNAVYARALQVTPAGYPLGWQTARMISVPTAAVKFLPLLQVVIAGERFSPADENNTGNIKFNVELTIAITIMRGVDDPVVLDGQADADLARILDVLLEDNSFTNPNLQDGYVWDGISKIESIRGIEQAQIETYAYHLTLNITFAYFLEFNPPTPYWLEEVDTTILDPRDMKTVLGSAVSQVGSINYAVIGPTTGPSGSPSDQFTARLEAGASFTGNQRVTIGDGGSGGTFTIGQASAVGSISYAPTDGEVFFAFTYTPAQAGVITLDFSNAQNWNDPEPFFYTSS